MTDTWEEILADMRMRALVAGQCSVEDSDTPKALLAAAEAEFLLLCADRAESLIRRERRTKAAADAAIDDLQQAVWTLCRNA